MRYQMLKRDIRLFLHCLWPAMALTAVFAVVCAIAAFAAVSNSRDVYTPVRAAVVDREDSGFNRMLIRAVAGTDYISDLLEISFCDMETAQEGMETGELAAVIVLPEGTFDAITSGTDAKGKIYLSPSVAAYSDIVKSVASFGELLLAAGQYGVFSGEELIWEYGLGERFHSDFLADANALLLGEAVGANSAYFDIQVLDYAGTGMSAQAYYVTSWSALLMMLLPMFFFRLYTQDLKKAMLCRLRGLGIRDGAFLLGKLICPAVFQLAVLGVILFVAGGHGLLSAGISAVVCAIMGVLVSAAVCGVFMMLGHRGVPLLIVTALIGLLLCGGIIPRQMMPDTLLLVGAVTPYGVIQNLLMPIFGRQFSWMPCGIGVVYAAIAAVAAHIRLRYVRMGGAET